MIKLDKLNRAEAVRYMGGAGIKLNYRMDRLMDECEKQILEKAEVRYLTAEIPLPDKDIMLGEDIKKHLEGCSKAVLVCATLGGEIDKLIRINQIQDMVKAVIMDSLASVAIEQACSRLDEMLAEKYKGLYMTFRFSPGYGDYPIELQKHILTRLNAQKKIGLTASDSYMLAPTKSVTAVIGLSEEPIEQKKRGCAICNMRSTCKYRRGGTHCGF